MKQKLEKLTSSIDLATKNIKHGKNWKINRKNTDKAFKKIGFTHLASGLHRECYISSDGKYIIKFDEIAKQNKPEIKVYVKIPESIKKYFLKPIAHDTKGFKWILTHKAETLDNGELSLSKANDIMYKLAKIFKEHNINMCDLHNSNVGQFKGKPVVIDYGFPITDKTNGKYLVKNSN